MVTTTAHSFKRGDFVEVIASLDLTYRESRGQGDNDVEVSLAMECVTRLYSEDELKVGRYVSCVSNTVIMPHTRNYKFMLV